MDTQKWHASLSEPIHAYASDEFGTLKTALVSALGSPEALAEQNGISITEARIFFATDMHDVYLQLAIFQEALQDRGVRLVYPRHPKKKLNQCQRADEWASEDVYCRDFLGVIDNHTIVTNVSQLRNHRRIFFETVFHQIEGEKTMLDENFPWGNALLHDDALFVGAEHQDIWKCFQEQGMPPEKLLQLLRAFDEKMSGFRSIERVLKGISATRKLVRVPLRSTLDLDVILAPLPRRTKSAQRIAMVQADRLHADARDVLEQYFDAFVLCEDPPEALGCNILWLDPETPVIASDAKKTEKVLRGLGFDPQVFDRSELQKLGIAKGGESGSWRCLTGALEREGDYSG